MASLRKANAYSKRIVVPFTRVSKRRQKSYIKVVPPQKIVKFTMGKTYFVDNVTVSRRAIHKILTHTRDTVALAFQLASDGATGLYI